MRMPKKPKRKWRHDGPSTGDAARKEREDQARYHATHLLPIWFHPEICPEQKPTVPQRRSDYQGFDEMDDMPFDEPLPPDWGGEA